MNIILYADQNSTCGERLLNMINALVLQDQIESHPSIDSLEKRLHRFIKEPAVLIIQISGLQELGQLLALRKLLIDRKLILILPDEAPETLTSGHTLRPRFLTSVDSDFKDVSAVLERMVSITSLSKDADYLADWPEVLC
jgi:hypothetical protein